MPNHNLETVSCIYEMPWWPATIRTEISTSPKDIAVDEHMQLLRTIINPTGYLYAWF
jgi:hypothetical protein